MTTLVKGLDHYQIGENGHIEYKFSNNIQEKILQFNFQLTRTDDNGLKVLQDILKSILTDLKYNIEKGTLCEK